MEMTTRKIRLSQTMTLSFRDISVSVAEVGNAAASILNQQTLDQANSTQTFDSLPDLLPYIFQSQEKLSSVPDVPCFAADCSPTYKLWESDVFPLASQSELEAEHWLLTGTQISRADNDISDSIPKIGLRENLRRVQAFSPHTSNIVFYVDLGELGSEEFGDVTCDAGAEFGSQPYSLDSCGTICPDSYLNLDEDMTKVDSPLVKSPVADAAMEIEREPDYIVNIGDDTDGVLADRYLDNVLNENMSHLTKVADSPPKESTVADVEMVNCRLSNVISEARPGGQKEHNADSIEKTRTKSRKLSPHDQATSDFYSLDFPKKIRKQKRSIAPRRRELGPSSSVELAHWMSDAGIKQDVPSDQPPQVTENLPDEEEKKASQTRKTKKRTVSKSSVRKLFREPPGDQNAKPKPRGRPGKKKSVPDQQPA